MLSNVGAIYWEKYIIFKRTGNYNKKSIDHAVFRPVVVIAEDDEYMYYLKISSSDSGKKRCVPITLFDKNNNEKVSYVYVNQIFRKKICFIESVQTLLPEQMNEIRIRLKKHNEKEFKDELYDSIKDKISEEFSNYCSKKLSLR